LFRREEGKYSNYFVHVDKVERITMGARADYNYIFASYKLIGLNINNIRRLAGI
jgi:hypothetical protein